MSGDGEGVLLISSMGVWIFFGTTHLVITLNTLKHDERYFI